MSKKKGLSNNFKSPKPPVRDNFSRKSASKIQDKNYTSYWIFAVIGLTLWSFFPAFFNEFTNWDDSGYVIDNKLIRGLDAKHLKMIFTSYVEGNYHPLTMLTLAIEYHFVEIQPGLYHFTNILIHILNAFLVFRVIYLLTKNNVIAGLTGIFFGIHPMHVESVAWVSELKDVQYSFFFLLALIQYLKYKLTDNKVNYALIYVFFILSLLSKGQAVVLPLTFFMVDYWLDRFNLKKGLLEKLPFLILSLIFGIVAVRAQASTEAIQDNTIFSIPERLVFACYGFITYLWKGFVPVKLSCFYPYPYRENGHIPYYFFYFPVLVAAIGFVVWRSIRKTKVLVFGFGFYLITIILVLQILAVGSTIISDRYSYLPYIGLFFMVSYAIHYLYQKFTNSQTIIWSMVGIFALSLTFVARAQCKVWQTSINLWTNVIEKYPQVPVAHNNKALIYKNKAEKEQDPQMKMELFEKAVEGYNNAIKVDPKYQGAFENRGNIYFLTQKYPEAISDFNQALKIKPKSEVAYNSRGAVYFNLQKLDSALNDFNKAIQLKPDYQEAYRNRGNTYSMLKMWKQAVDDYSVYLQYDKKMALIYFWRGLAEFNLGKFQEAIDDYTTTINMNPQLTDVYINRAIAFDKINNPAAATKDLETAQSLGARIDKSFYENVKSKAFQK